MPISRSELEQMLEVWQNAGARIETRTNKAMVYPADGDRPYAIHWTISDANAHKNMRTWGRRHGLPWYAEYNHNPNSRSQKEPTMTTTAFVFEPTNTMTSLQAKPSDRLLGKIHAAIKSVDPITVPNITRFMNSHGDKLSGPNQINWALYNLGYRPTGPKKHERASYTWAFDPDAPAMPDTHPYIYPDLSVHTRIADDARMVTHYAGDGHDHVGTDEVDRLIAEVNDAADRGMSADEHQATPFDDEPKVEPATVDETEWLEEIDRLQKALHEANSNMDVARDLYDDAQQQIARLTTVNTELLAERDVLKSARDEAYKRGAREAVEHQTKTDDWWPLEGVGDNNTFATIKNNAKVFGLDIRLMARRK